MERNPIVRKSDAARDIDLFFDVAYGTPAVTAPTHESIRQDRDHRRQGIKPQRKKFRLKREE